MSSPWFRFVVYYSLDRYDGLDGHRIPCSEIYFDEHHKIPLLVCVLSSLLLNGAWACVFRNHSAGCSGLFVLVGSLWHLLSLPWVYITSRVIVIFWWLDGSHTVDSRKHGLLSRSDD
ncbi:hypothetical protein B0T19DRAFT_430806 [Cercophora scortea]|uniref:Uncharacterized protein n=1 Tax=Cercophora scortea TaxID=314031 RepID=A0AAE0I9C6_9PEZI|nr:hypothetical protein B0T19DRAFT_430806 [Cercophora scortea]